MGMSSVGGVSEKVALPPTSVDAANGGAPPEQSPVQQTPVQQTPSAPVKDAKTGAEGGGGSDVAGAVGGAQQVDGNLTAQLKDLLKTLTDLIAKLQKGTSGGGAGVGGVEGGGPKGSGGCDMDHTPPVAPPTEDPRPEQKTDQKSDKTGDTTQDGGDVDGKTGDVDQKGGGPAQHAKAPKRPRAADLIRKYHLKLKKGKKLEHIKSGKVAPNGYEQSYKYVGKDGKTRYLTLHYDLVNGKYKLESVDRSKPRVGSAEGGGANDTVQQDKPKKPKKPKK